jgi:hypothetical protein
VAVVTLTSGVMLLLLTSIHFRVWGSFTNVAPVCAYRPWSGPQLPKVWGTLLLRLSSFAQPSQYSVWLHTGLPGFDPRRKKIIFPLAPVSRPALRPTQPPVQWVLGFLPGGKFCRGFSLTTHPILSSRLSRSYTSSSPWRLHGGSGTSLRFYFNFFV